MTPIYIDSHLHTSFSGDSETPPRAQIERACALGMQALCVTDHQDFEFPAGDISFLLDTGEYFSALSRLKTEYQEKIRLGIGVELGLQTNIKTDLAAYAASCPFDFIIGSVHASRGMDPYYPEFFEGLSEESAYRSYFEDELENFRAYDCFDVAGHLDFVVRYGPNKNRYYSYEKFSDILDEILRTLIGKGKGIECNTAGLRAGLGHPNPTEDILKRYRELGGEILTIGSDAHQPDYIGYSFDRAGALLKACGFRYYSVFHGRKPEFLPL